MKELNYIEIANRLKARRMQMNYSYQELADKVGMSKSTLQRYETGMIKNIPIARLKSLSAALNMNPNELIGIEEDTPLPPGLLPLPTTKKIPRLGRIACGRPIMTEENFDGYDDIPENIHADFSLICSGDSMINARIRDGDIVYIRLQEQVENGEIAAVYIDGETTLKRVYLSPGQLVLQAENPQYAPMVYTGPELENIRIIGKAVGFTSVI